LPDPTGAGGGGGGVAAISGSPGASGCGFSTGVSGVGSDAGAGATAGAIDADFGGSGAAIRSSRRSVCTPPPSVSRTVKMPRDSSVARISYAGLRASAAFAQSISRTCSPLPQAASSKADEARTTRRATVFMTPS
jgi:hypothetical protein